MKRRASTVLSTRGRYEKKPKRFIGPMPRNIGGGYQRGRESTLGGTRGELKAFDVSNFNLAGTGAGSFRVLNVPINGAELYQRIGRKIYMKNLQIKGLINYTAVAAAAGQDFLRLVLYYDAQPNAAQCVIGDLFADSNAGAGVNAFSKINLTNRARFQILRDFQIMTPLIAAGTNWEGPDQSKDFSVDWFVKLKGLETEYNGVNGGTIADVTSGALGLVLFDLANSNQWQLSCATRLRYYDT